MDARMLLDPASRPVIGHRGAAGLAPENTIPSFDLALEQGADALEFDVRLTADGVPVVLHDPTVDRTTDGHGAVREMSLADLGALDAGAGFSPQRGRFPFRGQGIRVPTLRQALERYSETALLIELKAPEAQGPVRDELIRAGAERRAVVASFLSGALATFREPRFQVGAARRDIVALKLWSVLGLRPRDRGVLAYAVPYRYKDRVPVPTAAFVRCAHRLGRPVHVWTVDDPAIARRLWSIGVSGMITNFPGRMVEARPTE